MQIGIFLLGHIFKRGNKMRYINFVVIITIICFALLLPTRLYAESNQKIGYIDSQRIVEESIKGKEALQKIKAIRNKNVSEIEKLTKDIESLDNEKRKKEFALTAEGKAEIEEKIRLKYLDLKKFRDSKEQELKEIYLKNLKAIEDQVIDIVRKIGRDGGFTLILGKDESGIIFADTKIDLTDKVIKEYDQPKN